jgi:natural product precursor
MKQKFFKKLVLNKTTVSDLNSEQMNDVRGGLTITDPRACHTYETRCSQYQTIYYTCPAGCPPCLEI